MGMGKESPRGGGGGGGGVPEGRQEASAVPLAPALAPRRTRVLQIHWFSIFNSFMMVIFLTGLVAMILARTLRNDYAKYTRESDDLESLERDLNEESGWKLCHGDAFRPPARLELLAALIGTGVQLASLILAVILITIAGEPAGQEPL